MVQLKVNLGLNFCTYMPGRYPVVIEKLSCAIVAHHVTNYSNYYTSYIYEQVTSRFTVITVTDSDKVSIVLISLLVAALVVVIACCVSIVK